MKIAILTPAHPFRGGIAASSERMAQQLIADGHEVTIYNFKLQYPSILFPGKTQKTTDAAPEGLKILSRLNSVNPFNWWRVGREIRREKPDLLIVRYWLPFMGPSLGTVCRLVRKNGYTKVICVADNIIPHETRLGDKAFTGYFTKQVDGFVTLSREVYDDVARFVSEPHRRYTPHPIYDHYGAKIGKSDALGKLGLEEGRYLLFFGFIRDYKGLDLLLHAMTMLDTNIRLIVAGEFYGNSEKYLKLTEELGLTERVIYYSDYIPNDEVNRYFCAADLLVQPYKTATQSGVTQVGYAFDMPMLVTNVGGLPEIIDNGKSGYVVEPSAEAISMAVKDFYDNRRSREFSEETHRLRSRYSWGEMTRVIMDLYKEIS